MIAVVVLATGLLALAALQGSLARASGEAKVRSRVAALLSTRMEQLRANQYIGAATLANDSCATDLGAGVDWVPASFCTEAGLGAITTSQQVSTWSSAVGATSFTQGRVPDVGEPEFKRVTLTATWTDASNESHRLAMTSELSALALRDALLPPPPGAGTPTGQALVRTDSPVTAGVVPIAIGGDNATAASNPRPEIIGARNNQSVVGTKFEVITYQGLTGAAVIQRRIETQAIKCTCKYGAGGSNLPEIYRKAQWPAIWTGERYEVYEPSPAANAPGTAAASGKVSSVDQSDLCQECCRDHHDTAIAGVPKFDPERVITAGQVHEHSSVDNQGNLILAPNTINSEYVDACRVIRVDGFWRTAADMYSRHMGLLATETVATKAAKTGVPSTSAASAYQTFVKDYLTGYTGLVATAPSGADAMFAQPTRLLDEPASIAISRPAPKDERYLHGRGLYVDYLEKAARDKIKSARAKCPTNTNVTECMLPYLPFTTINVTELGFWEPQKLDATASSGVISVASGSALIFDPLAPTRGRTNAMASSTNGDVAFSAIEIGRSNAGVAVSTGVDTDDETVATDRQQFVVTAPLAPPVGENFSVQLSGADLVQVSDTSTTNDPSVAWALTSTGGSGNCNATIKASNPGRDLNPNPYMCATDGTLGGAGSVLVGNYGREYTVSASTTSSICTYNGVAKTATASVAYPTFANLRVSSASMSLGGPNGSIGTPLNSTKRTESTLVTFTSIPKNAVATIGFTLEGTATATIAACTTDKNGNSITVTSWTKPWDAP
jgi:Tfp pilus assembly protein PilV